MKFYFFLFLKFITASSSSDDDENFLGRIRKPPSLKCLKNSETSSKKTIKNVEYERFDSLYINESKSLNLQFGVLINGKVPDRSYAFKDTIFSGVASIGLNRNAGYQKNKGQLTEDVRVLVNRDDIITLNGKIRTFMLPITIYENLKTKYISVPVIFSTEKLTIHVEDTNLYNIAKPSKLLFYLLFSRNVNFKYPEDRKKVIDNLKSLNGKSKTELESQFKLEGRRFLFFENNFDLLQQAARRLADDLEEKRLAIVTRLESFFENSITKINTNDFLTSSTGEKYININENTSKKLLDLIKYAYINDCANLLKYANDTSSTTDIYECYDRNNCPNIDVAIAFLFNFKGSNLLKNSDIKITGYKSQEGSGGNPNITILENFETFVYNNKLHVMVHKKDISRGDCIIKLKIQLNTKNFTYETNLIDVDPYKRPKK